MSEPAFDIRPLYLEHRDAMFAVAASVLRATGRSSEAEDVVSDTVVSILAAPPKVPVDNWEAFLVTATKRKAIDLLRSAGARHDGGTLDESVHDAPDDVDIATDVAEAIDLQRRAAIGWDSLSILTDRQRYVVWQYLALDRPRAEVAAELDVSPGRVSQIATESVMLLHAEILRREAAANGQ